MNKIVIFGHSSNLYRSFGDRSWGYPTLNLSIRDTVDKNLRVGERPVIINFASANPKSILNTGYMQQNYEIAKNIARFAESVGVETIINISAMSIFNGSNVLSVCGFTKPAPLDDYSKSKVQMETVLMDSKISNVVNVRIPGVDEQWNSHCLFQRFRNAIISGNSVSYHSGHFYVNNVINSTNIFGFIGALLGYSDIGRKNFNLGSAEPMTVLDILTAMKRKYQSGSKLIETEPTGSPFNIDVTEELRIFKLSPTLDYV